MTRLEVRTAIRAPQQACFDLARDVAVHADSMKASGERVVARPPHARLEVGDEVTFAGRHFGLPLRLTARITEMAAPACFVDEQVAGPFAHWRHRHEFHPVAAGTEMVDTVDYALPAGPLGRLADRLVVARYLRRLLTERATHLRSVAESGVPPAS